MSVKAMKWAYGLFEVANIPAKDRLVLLALCWDHTDAGGCYPSQDRIADLSGFTRRRVNDYLSSLESSGLIKRKTTRKGGKFQKTRYELFGVYKVKPCADGSTRHRVQKKAHGHRVQTGAQYRGTNKSTGKLIDFPVQKSCQKRDEYTVIDRHDKPEDWVIEEPRPNPNQGKGEVEF